MTTNKLGHWQSVNDPFSFLDSIIYSVLSESCTWPYREWRGASSAPLWSWSEVRTTLWFLPWWVQYQKWRAAYSHSSHVPVCFQLCSFFCFLFDYIYIGNHPYFVGLMLKRVEKQYFLMLNLTVALCHITMNCRIALSEVSQWSQKWGTHCFFGVWNQMAGRIHQVCMVRFMQVL
jgi:hypothetical protein